MLPLFINGANTSPEQVLYPVKASSGEPDIVLGHPKPLCADLQSGLQILQLPSLLLKLSINPVQLIRKCALFLGDLPRLLALMVQLFFDLTEFVPLLSEAR